MKINLQEGASSAELSFAKWDLGIVGKPLDDRGRAAVRFVRKHTRESMVIEYDPDSYKVTVNGAQVIADDLDSSFDESKGKLILLEASTLGFVEILLCCRALFNRERALSLVYVEPENYTLTTTMRRSPLLHKRDFELSDEVPGFKAIPGAALYLSDKVPQRTVFFLGYEERRLDRALEDHQTIRPASCSVVFGVPAFRPGWEMNAFANNMRVIKERNIRGGIYFCGAENPSAAFELLRRIHRELGSGERLFVAPLGTKPMGIGVALFAAKRSDIGILYDHPKRREKRSDRVGRWHLYTVEDSQ